ncbi:MAG TPA: DUF2378 family protein [Polyangiaceae bacterium]|nr:DUF2378 family protein [Polyangiaceae bacterium]
MIPPRDGRKSKGVNLVGLVKALRAYRKGRPLPAMSPEAEALLGDHILASEWYPLRTHLEILEIAYRVLAGSRPENALQMGVTGGKAIWTSTHRGVLEGRNAVRALESMPAVWRTYFNFGSLDVEVTDPTTVRFTVQDYPDVPVYHGMTIAGWHLAVALVSGATDATVEIVERPWAGGTSTQVHVLHLAAEPTPSHSERGNHERRDRRGPGR